MSGSIATQRMTGIVLCGGQSTRMGSDKGLLQQDGLTWAEIAASKLRALHLPVVLSINRQQLTPYKNLFAEESLVIDNEDLLLSGPLLGLLSVHLRYPTDDLLLLACDLKDMTESLLKELRKHSLQKTHEAYVYSTAAKHQPLCGIYTPAILKKTCYTLQTGQLKKHSMMALLETGNTKFIAVRAKDIHSFNNYNSPAEI